jgi:CHAD domain-containing protein
MAKEREIEGLAAEMPFAEAGALVVETRARELLEHSEGALDTGHIEGVHDMRVATRRLRAALEVFAPCFPKEEHKKALKEVKAIADALGERRDRDVAIASLTVFAAEMPAPDRPGIESLTDRFRAEQLEANSALAPFVDPKRLTQLHRSLAELARSARAAAGNERKG